MDVVSWCLAEGTASHRHLHLLLSNSSGPCCCAPEPVARCCWVKGCLPTHVWHPACHRSCWAALAARSSSLLAVMAWLLSAQGPRRVGVRLRTAMRSHFEHPTQGGRQPAIAWAANTPCSSLWRCQAPVRTSPS